MAVVTIDYVHDHECSRSGQRVVDRVASRDGVEWRVVPRCVEADVELTLASRTVVGD